MQSVSKILSARCQEALVDAFGESYQDIDPLIAITNNPKFGDFQSNVALSLAKPLKQPPRAIAEQIVGHLNVEDICDPPTIAGPGFVNFSLSTQFLESSLRTIHGDDRLGIAVTESPQTIVVDFSSPNIAKEMHVGHLRSTIIGDCIARVLEFQGHHVLRLNHVGDWGTQFGMLITYLKEACPEALTTANALDLGDLVTFYKQAKQRFDESEAFQVASREEVVRLQAGEKNSLQAWELLCDQSRREFEKIYSRLDIEIQERGESFYNPYLEEILEHLADQNLLEENQGAQCVFLEGFKNKDGDPQPLIVQKSDGGYNYATTDLAALKYRIQQDQAQRLIYVTDAGQANHFAQVFQVANRAHLIPKDVEIVHVPFGLVQGEDGKKLKTRSGETIRLKDLLDEAVAQAKIDLLQRLQDDDRHETDAFIDQVSTVIGLGAVKYADLSQNRTSNYIFSYEKMLARQGNTAPYMIYAYVRVQGISRKGDIDLSRLSSEAEIILREPSELTLMKHLLQFQSTLQSVSTELMPNRLCQYLFELSQKFNQFYDQCQVLTEDERLRTSRLVLCDTTARTIKLGLSLLGIAVVERI